MKVLSSIYESLKSEGYCASQNEFSERYLGRTPGYYAWLKSTGADCCPVSLQLLADRLYHQADDLRNPVPSAEDKAEIDFLHALRLRVCGLADAVAEARGQTLDWGM